MSSKHGKLQISGNVQGEYKCIWTIESYSSLDLQVGESHRSYCFQLDETGIKWFLEIFPEGCSEDTKGFVSCYIHVSNITFAVRFRFCLSLHTTDGTELFNGKLEKWVKLSNHGPKGFIKMIAANDLKPKLVNDTLVVTLHATYCMTCVEDSDGSVRQAEITPMMKMAEDFRNLWISKENTDFTIHVEGNDIPAHSSVLCARSKVFAAMCRHDTLEKQTHRVEIKDFEKDTVKSFMEFIYTGFVLQMCFNLAMELLRASDVYEVSDLKLYCSNYLLTHINDGNVCHILVNADICNAKKLRANALEYLRENLSEDNFEAQRSVFKERPELIYDVVKDFIKRRKISRE